MRGSNYICANPKCDYVLSGEGRNPLRPNLAVPKRLTGEPTPSPSPSPSPSPPSAEGGEGGLLPFSRRTPESIDVFKEPKSK